MWTTRVIDALQQQMAEEESDIEAGIAEVSGFEVDNNRHLSIGRQQNVLRAEVRQHQAVGPSHALVNQIEQRRGQLRDRAGHVAVKRIEPQLVEDDPVTEPIDDIRFGGRAHVDACQKIGQRFDKRRIDPPGQQLRCPASIASMPNR